MKTIRKTSPLCTIIRTVSDKGRVYHPDLALCLHSKKARTYIRNAMTEREYRYRDRTYACTILDSDGKGAKRILSLHPSASELTDEITGTASEVYRARLREQGTDRASRERIAEQSRCEIAAALIGAPLVDATAATAMSYVTAKQIKQYAAEEDKRIRFSQACGMLIDRFHTPVPMFACSGSKGVVFHGFGEEKIIEATKRYFRLDPETQPLDTCIITADSYAAAYDTLRKRRRRTKVTATGSDDDLRITSRVTDLYRHVIFATMDAEGVNTLRLYVHDPLGNAIIRLLVPADPDLPKDAPGQPRYYEDGSIFEYDAVNQGRCFVQFLTGDIARLNRIAAYLANDAAPPPLTVYCFPGQTGLVEKLFSGCKRMPEIIPLSKTDALMDTLGLEPFTKVNEH